MGVWKRSNLNTSTSSLWLCDQSWPKRLEFVCTLESCHDILKSLSLSAPVAFQSPRYVACMHKITVFLSHACIAACSPSSGSLRGSVCVNHTEITSPNLTPLSRHRRAAESIRRVLLRFYGCIHPLLHLDIHTTTLMLGRHICSKVNCSMSAVQPLRNECGRWMCCAPTTEHCSGGPSRQTSSRPVGFSSWLNKLNIFWAFQSRF